MTHLSKKTLLPMFVLLLAAGCLLATWWFSADPGSSPDGDRVDHDASSDARSQQVLITLTALRKGKNPRQFTAAAGELIRTDQTLSADELANFGSELFQAGYLETAELCFRKSLSPRISDATKSFDFHGESPPVDKRLADIVGLYSNSGENALVWACDSRYPVDLARGLPQTFERIGTTNKDRKSQSTALFAANPALCNEFDCPRL